MSTTSPQAERFPNAGNLISRSTILILGGVLIGMAVGRLITHPHTVICLLAGMFSFVAFIGLEIVATKSRR